MDKLYKIGINELIKKYNIDVKNKKKVPYIILDENITKNSIVKIINQSGVIIIPSYFYNEYIENLIDDKNYRSIVIYPVQKGVESYNKKISTAYVYEKFNIYEKYILVDGFLNEERLIEDINQMLDDEQDLIIVVAINKNDIKYSVLEKIDLLGLTEKIIFIKIKSSNDLINLINAAELVVNLDSEEKLNYNLINAICLNKNIVCSANQLNYELLENYPYYFNNSIKFSELIKKNKKYVRDREIIIHKFLEEANLIELKNKIDGELYEV